MASGKNVKSAEGDLMIRTGNQIIISPQLTNEATAVILNDKITAKKECGKFNNCTGCKLLICNTL